MLVSNIVQNQTYSDSKVRVATAVGRRHGSDLDPRAGVPVEVARAHPRCSLILLPAALLRFGDSSLDLELSGSGSTDPEEGMAMSVRKSISRSGWRSASTGRHPFRNVKCGCCKE